MPVPLLKIKEGYSKFEGAKPQQYLENKTYDYFTGGEEVGSRDSGIDSGGSEFEETPEVDASKQNAPYSFCTEQAFKGSNSACYDDRLDFFDFSRNDSAFCSCTQNSCLNANDVEFLNRAYEFYVNDVISLSSNKRIFSVNCK